MKVAGDSFAHTSNGSARESTWIPLREQALSGVLSHLLREVPFIEACEAPLVTLSSLTGRTSFERCPSLRPPQPVGDGRLDHPGRTSFERCPSLRLLGLADRDGELGESHLLREVPFIEAGWAWACVLLVGRGSHLLREVPFIEARTSRTSAT